MKTLVIAALLVSTVVAEAAPTTWGHWDSCYYLLYGNNRRDLQQDTQVCGQHGSPGFNRCMTKLGWKVQCHWSMNKSMPGDLEQEFQTPAGPCGSLVC
jgi:hypothetical protein